MVDLDVENTWTTLLDSNWVYDLFKLHLKSSQTTLLNLDWFYILDLKNTWTILLDSDWFYYNQLGMLLEKSENLLELSVKQLLIQSSLTSLIFLGHTMFLMCEKPKVFNFVCDKVRYFCIFYIFLYIQQELSNAKSILILFKR